MFYSQNLLAKKGPFGTVWCAAHLQNRLKKPNYIAINIPATVEQIMNPPLPIALRMSGYLLFGVVRIYSKKVEYLQHDCNVLRIDISKAYANADINLPEDANQAKYDSITLPDNFALDLIDINDHDLNQSPDSHIRPNEDISFIDYTPVSFSKNRFGTPAGYIKISVGDDAFRSPINEDIPGPGYSPEISNPHTPPPTVDGVQDLDPNNHLESNFIDEDDVAPRETLRIHNSNHQKSPPVSSALPDTMEPDPVIVKAISEFNNIDSSNLKDIPDNSGPLSPLRQVTPQEIVHSENENDVVQDSFGQPSFELAPSSSREKRSAERAPFSLREKRPAELALHPVRVKRRKLKYDKATVLTNEFMKNSIDDASRLKRKRKGVSSFLGVYRLNNAYKKQQVLFDPVITGLCDNLSQMHEDGNVSSKAHLSNIIEQANPDAMEVGRNSEFAYINDNNMIPLSPPDHTEYSSPRGGDENTPAYDTDIGSKSYQAPTTIGTSVGPTPDPASSIGSFMSDTETPFFQSEQAFDNTGGLYDIPEVDDVDELSMMEDNDGTPSLRGTPDAGSLLPRTRCVAKLIKEKSAATSSSSECFGSVSMKNMLQGKTRKVCSRMFFETLVLKSCDLIDVKQDEPYGDISLKVTQKLSKLEFSN